MLLNLCAVSAVCAALLVVMAALQPRSVVLRVVWTVLLVMGAVLPFVLLPAAWWQTRFVIPFLGPPVRIGLLPVWWALAAVVLAFVAAAVDAARARRWSWWAVVPPVHAVAVLRREWR